MEDQIKTTAEAIEAAALPKAHVVHISDCPPTAEEQPLPKSVAAKPLAQKSAAEWAYERLILYIRNFEEQLDNEHEVAMVALAVNPARQAHRVAGIRVAQFAAGMGSVGMHFSSRRLV